jgi:alpha-1,2-mannosyltransferase
MSPAEIGRRLGAKPPLTVVLLGIVPIMLVLVFALAAIGERKYAWDFHVFWLAAHHVVHGVSPYANAHTASPYPAFLYPPLVALALVPLGAMPFPVAAAIFTILVILAAGLTLWVLGVRDWRCYGSAFASMPILGGIRLGALTTLLALLLALAWRYRDRRLITASLVAVAAVAKIFLWPIGVWLLATRRIATAATALALAVATVADSWLVIGFAGARHYPAQMAQEARDRYRDGYTLGAVAHRLGLSYADARLLTVALIPILVLGIVVVARRANGDQASFSVAVGASLLLSPIVWLHYFTLLFVVIAIRRPTFGLIWLAPLCLWVTPQQESGGSPLRVGIAVALTAAVVIAALGEARRHASAAPTGRVILADR